MKHKHLSLVVLLIFSVLASAQGHVFTNKDVIEMVKAGLSADIIKAKIVSTDAAFDTSAPALKELKDSGVPEDVIIVVIKHPFGGKSGGPQNPMAVSVVDRPTEYGTIQDLKGLSKVFVRASDDDARSTIIAMLSGYEGVQTVGSANEAEIILDYETLTRDVAPGRYGASMALKSQMRAYTIKPDGTKLIGWTETETFDVTNGFVLGASNEVNLTHHFVRALQKVRGEKTYSLRKLYQNSQKHKKEMKAKKS